MENQYPLPEEPSHASYGHRYDTFMENQMNIKRILVYGFKCAANEHYEYDDGASNAMQKAIQSTLFSYE